MNLTPKFPEPMWLPRIAEPVLDENTQTKASSHILTTIIYIIYFVRNIAFCLRLSYSEVVKHTALQRSCHDPEAVHLNPAVNLDQSQGILSAAAVQYAK